MSHQRMTTRLPVMASLRTASDSKDAANYVWLAAIVVTLLGFGIRLHYLAGDSFWYDEILTVNIARSDFERALSVRSHPPLFYLTVSAVMKILGPNEFAARLPSAVMGTLAIPLMVMWGKVTKRPYAGLWAALLLALSPFHLRYSQEARHYAGLMFFSLAAYIALYLAVRGGKWREWLVFALITVVNIYMHYGALVVLAAQTIFLLGWLLWQWTHGSRYAVFYPLGSALVVVALLLPWLPKLLFAFNWNLGETAVRGNQNITAISVWAREIFYAFGTAANFLPYLLVMLFLAGLLIWFKKDWLALAFVGSSAILPFILIQLFQVSRWAFAKYVIYTFPPFLLIVGVALDSILRESRRMPGRYGPYAYRTGSLAMLLLLCLMSVPLILDEYQFAERDWRGVANYLDDAAEDGDTVLIVTLDLKSGFNQGEFVMSYYLSQAAKEYHVLAAQKLDEPLLNMLLTSSGKVWVIFLDRITDDLLTDSFAQLRPFQGALFLFEDSQETAVFLDQMITIYEKLLPAAVDPSPQCLLKEDLALLYVKSQDYLRAKQVYSEAKEQCEGRVNGRFPGDYDLVQEIYHGLIPQYQQENQDKTARLLASELLALNPKDSVALNALTVIDLLHEFENGNAQQHLQQNIEPVQKLQYTMPHNGDWGDVLLIHPPNSLSFQVKLPDEAAQLYLRAAMAPESWSWGGDGSTFVILVKTETQPAAELFRQHISNDPSDQDWHEISLPLTKFAGQNITLTLAAEPGPAGDFTGDWAGWETPRIIYSTES